MRSAILLSAALVGYANGLDSFALRRGREHLGAVRLALNLGGTAALLAWAHWGARLAPAEIGLRRRANARPVVAGLLTGLGMALLPLALFFFPRLPGGRLAYAPLAESSLSSFLRRVLDMTLAVAICEEVAFRGVLHGLLRRHLSALPTLVAGSLPFTLWHIAVTWNTVSRTSLPRRPAVRLAALLAGLGSVFAGGLFFGALRDRTGNLLAPIAAHWAVDLAMLLALFRRRAAPAAAVVAAEVEE